MQSSTSCYHTCHKHPVGTDHQSPGLCLRQDPFHSSTQASAAGRSSSTKHCSQWGHLTPDTPSVSREVTRAPSNPLRLNLPPETSSPSTPSAVNSHQQQGHASPTTQPLRRRARPELVPALLACLPEHCGDIHASAKAGWQEAGQESSGDGYGGAGGAGTSAPSGCLRVTALFRSALRAQPRAVSSRVAPGDVTCSKCALHPLKTL